MGWLSNMLLANRERHNRQNYNVCSKMKWKWSWYRAHSIPPLPSFSFVRALSLSLPFGYLYQFVLLIVKKWFKAHILWIFNRIRLFSELLSNISRNIWLPTWFICLAWRKRERIVMNDMPTIPIMHMNTKCYNL